MTVYVNGVAGASVDPLDRGLQYGDGLFETMAVQDGRARFFDWHLARLAEGARRLALPMPDQTMVRDAWRCHCPTRASWPRRLPPPGQADEAS